MTFGWSFPHNSVVFKEAKWWHHLSVVPGKMPGGDETNRRAISLPYSPPVCPNWWVKMSRRLRGCGHTKKELLLTKYSNTHPS